MTHPDSARRYAATQAFYWARVAGGMNGVMKEREVARELSNTEPDAATPWQRWLLDHLGAHGVDVEQAIRLAEMWVKVAASQAEEQEGEAAWPLG